MLDSRRSSSKGTSFSDFNESAETLLKNTHCEQHVWDSTFLTSCQEMSVLLALRSMCSVAAGVQASLQRDLESIDSFKT